MNRRSEWVGGAPLNLASRQRFKPHATILHHWSVFYEQSVSLVQIGNYSFAAHEPRNRQRRSLDAGTAMDQHGPRLILLDPLHRMIESNPIGANAVRGRSISQRHQYGDVAFSRNRSGFENIEHSEVARDRDRRAGGIADPETGQNLMRAFAKYRAHADAPPLSFSNPIFRFLRGLVSKRSSDGAKRNPGYGFIALRLPPRYRARIAAISPSRSILSSPPTMARLSVRSPFHRPSTTG
jgi:hypothetical protein